MSTKLKPVDEKFQVKQYKIQYPISAYTFPHETYIHAVRFDDKYIHIELTDGRALSVPLSWIPTVQNALPEEREKYEINRDRTMIIWNPDKCAINDEIRIADYMESAGDTSNIVAEKKAEYHTKSTARKCTAIARKPRPRR